MMMFIYYARQIFNFIDFRSRKNLLRKQGILIFSKKYIDTYVAFSHKCELILFLNLIKFLIFVFTFVGQLINDQEPRW